MHSFIPAYFRTQAIFASAPFLWLRCRKDCRFTYKLHPVLCVQFLFTVVFFFSAQSLSAQLDIQWDRTIGGVGGDGLYITQPTTDGGYILGGMSGYGINGNQTPPGKGKEDYWVVKVSATGAVEWDKVFGGSEYDELDAVLQTPDGGYILGGSDA